MEPSRPQGYRNGRASSVKTIERVTSEILTLLESGKLAAEHEGNQSQGLDAHQTYGSIPPESYGLIAEILAFLYRIDQEEALGVKTHCSKIGRK